MPPLRALLFLALFALLFSSVHAATLPLSVDSSNDVLPISVAVKRPLRELQTSYVVAESVRQDERATYTLLQRRLLNVSESEKPLLRAQVSEQRQRVLFSTLNVLTIIFQRAEYLVDNFDAGLLRMRVKLNSQDNQSITNSSERLSELTASLASLKEKSAELSRQLSSAPSSVNLSRDLVKIKSNLSALLVEIESFSLAYRSLAQDIVSRQ